MTNTDGGIIKPCGHCGKLTHFTATQRKHWNAKLCQPCESAQAREYRKNNPKVRERERRRDQERWKDPEFVKKARARDATRYAIRTGRLKRQPCGVCGAKAEVHHDDYSKPLDVRWLCQHHPRQHHLEADARKEAA